MFTEITSTTSTFTTKNTITTFAASITTITTVLLLIFQPDRLLAHEDEEHEDSAKQVEDVHTEEEVVEKGVFKFRPVSDEDCVDAFESPQEAKDKEELCVEYLHTYFSVYCNRESD